MVGSFIFGRFLDVDCYDFPKVVLVMVAFIVISGLTLGLTHTVKLTVKPAYIKRKNQVVSFDNYLTFSGAEDGAQTRDPQLGRLIALNSFGIEITN